MVTKGEILTIDYLSNTCTIRMPLFETIASNPITTTAIFAIQPGMFNGYQVGDIVEVGFENNMINKPVVLGKLYLGVKNENNNYRGAIKCDSLEIKNKAILPSDTQISYVKGQNSVSIDSDATKYTSIKDIIDSVQKLENSSNSVYFDDGENQSTTKTKLAEYIVIDGVRKKLGTSLSDLKDYTDFSSQIQTNFKKVDDKLTWEIEKVDYQISALDEEQRTITTKIESVETATDEKLGQLKKETDTSLQIAVGEIHSWVDEQIKDESGSVIKQLRTDIEQNAAAIDLVAQKQEGDTYNISQLEVTANNISAEVKEKVNSVDGNSENTFGWVMNADGVNFYDENKDVLNINSEGLKVAGEIQAESGHIGCVTNVIPSINDIVLKSYFELQDYFKLPEIDLKDKSEVSTDTLSLCANFADNIAYPDYSVRLNLKALPENKAEILATFEDKRSSSDPKETTEINLNIDEVFSEIYTNSASISEDTVDITKLKNNIYIELKETATSVGKIATFNLSTFDSNNYSWAIFTSEDTDTEYNLEVYFDINEDSTTILKYEWLNSTEPFDFDFNWCYYDENDLDLSIFTDKEYIINITKTVSNFTNNCVLNKYITLYNPFSYAIHSWTFDNFFEIKLDPNKIKKSDTGEELGSTGIIAYYQNNDNPDNWYELKLTANTDYVTSEYFKGLKDKKEDSACYWKYEWFAITPESFTEIKDADGNILYKEKNITPIENTLIYSGYVLYDEILESASLVTNDDGFKITTNNIHNTKKTFDDYLANGIYLGTDGIGLGAGEKSENEIKLFTEEETYNGIHKFSVSKNGNVIATEGIFGLPQKLTGVEQDTSDNYKVSIWQLTESTETKNSYIEAETPDYNFIFPLFVKNTNKYYFIATPDSNNTIPLILTKDGVINKRGNYKFRRFYYKETTNFTETSYLYKNNNLYLEYVNIINSSDIVTATEIDISNLTSEEDIKSTKISFINSENAQSDEYNLDDLFDISTRGFNEIFTNRELINCSAALLKNKVFDNIGTYFEKNNLHICFKDSTHNLFFQFNYVNDSTKYLSYLDLTIYNSVGQKDSTYIKTSELKKIYITAANASSILNTHNRHFLKISWNYETDFTTNSLNTSVLYLSSAGYHTRYKTVLRDNTDGCIYSAKGLALRKGNYNTIIDATGLSANNATFDTWSFEKDTSTDNSDSALSFSPNNSSYSIKIGSKILKPEVGDGIIAEPYIGIHFVGSQDDSITDYSGDNGIPIKNIVNCGYHWSEIYNLTKVLKIKTFTSEDLNNYINNSSNNPLVLSDLATDQVTLLNFKDSTSGKVVAGVSVDLNAEKTKYVLNLTWNPPTTTSVTGSITVIYICL